MNLYSRAGVSIAIVRTISIQLIWLVIRKYSIGIEGNLPHAYPIVPVLNPALTS